MNAKKFEEYYRREVYYPTDPALLHQYPRQQNRIVGALLRMIADLEERIVALEKPKQVPPVKESFGPCEIEVEK